MYYQIKYSEKLKGKTGLTNKSINVMELEMDEEKARQRVSQIISPMVEYIIITGYKSISQETFERPSNEHVTERGKRNSMRNSKDWKIRRWK